jgi:hypothetical protein
METETIYAATHIDKEVVKDDYHAGEIGRRTCLLHEGINITAPTLKELIEKIEAAYALDIDHVFVREDSFSYNRTEDDDGNEADEHDIALWKENKNSFGLLIILSWWKFAL